MSLLNKASLIQIPSGYKDGTLYSAKPTNGDGDFTFSRGSNLAATRVNSEGLIEKGRENLLLQSNTFDTTWTTTSSITLTSGQSGYDGSSNAWLLERTSSGGQRVAQTISSSGVQTYSVYAKANVGNWLYMRCNTSGSPVEAYFDLANGVLGAYGSTTRIDAKIQAIGNGWYRCSMAFNSTTVEARLYPVDGNGSVSGTNESIYIQDSQLEVGLVSTDVITTTTTTAQAGILEDMPRLDYSGGASCPSLLLEPQRSNLATSSEYFEQVFTEPSGVSWEHNSTTSPEGLNNASKLINSSNNQGAYYVSMSFTDNDTMTASIFAKQGSRNTLQFGVSNQNESNSYYYRFNLSEGTATYYANNGGMLNGTGSIEDYGNGWYRCIVTATFPSSGTTSGGVFPRVVGTGNLYLYGLQVEKNVSYPTSYIPTYGSSVTRSADVSTLLNTTGIIGQTEGTILFDAYFDVADSWNFSLSDSSASNYINIDTTSGKAVFARVQSGGATQMTINTSGSYFDNGDRLKCAIGYKENDFAFYINGTQIGTDTSGTIPTLDDIRFARYNGSIPATQRVNEVVLFPTRLTNDELADLTTL